MSVSFPKGALTHHPGGEVVFPLEIVRSPRGMRLLRQPDGQCHTGSESAVIVHAVGVRYVPNRIPSLEATVFHQLPAQTCHRQICMRNDYQLK